MTDGGDSEGPLRKVFISYAHSSEDHKDWVEQLASELQSVGIETVLDAWHLKEGDDAHYFMETMVRDETVDRVVIVCDETYAKKADNRQGGVGTESQIISSEIYTQVKDSKFLPIIRSYEDGHSCVPIYLNTRYYIDFSNDEEFPEKFEQLARAIADKPARVPPPLGKVPEWLRDDADSAITTLACARSARLFRQCLITGKGNPATIWSDFAREVESDIDSLLVETKPSDTLPERLMNAIETSRPLRDSIVDVVVLAIEGIHEPWLMPAMNRLLSVITKKIGERRNTDTPQAIDDGVRFLANEVFLYVLALAIKNKQVSLLKSVSSEIYAVGHDYLRREFEDVSVFSAHGRTLQTSCNENKISMTGELIKRRATVRDVSISDLAEADALVLLRGYVNTIRWTPSAAVYRSGHVVLPVIDQAMQSKDFTVLDSITGISTVEQLESVVMGDDLQRLATNQHYWRTALANREIFGAEMFRKYG